MAATAHDQLVEYLRTLRITQGPLAGTLFDPLPWERRFLRGAFRESTDTAALSIARGNGKSTMVSAIAAAMVAGPLAQPRVEATIVASSFRQAKIVFDHAKAFLGPELEARPRRYRVADSDQRAVITDRLTGAGIRCVGSDASRLHGLAGTVILDEPAQMVGGGDRVFAAMRTTLGKVAGDKLIALGTRPADPDHWFSKLLAGTADYAQVHAASPDDPPFRIATIRKANPSLSAMPHLERTIRKEAAQAKRDPALFASYAALRLNLGVADTLTAHLIEADTWRACEGDDAAREGPAVWGVDLGTSAASSAIVAYWPSSHRLEAVAAFPSEPTLADRGARDGVGHLYGDMARRGELVTLGGRAVSIPELLAEARDRFGDPATILADRWREAELRDALEAAGIPPAALILRGQGFRDGGADVRDFRRACLEGRVRAPVSLLLRSALAGARVTGDPAGNFKLSKGSESGRRQTHRDDAAAAAILAVAEGERQRSAPAPVGLRYAVAG